MPGTVRSNYRLPKKVRTKVRIFRGGYYVTIKHGRNGETQYRFVSTHCDGVLGSFLTVLRPPFETRVDPLFLEAANNDTNETYSN